MSEPATQHPTDAPATDRLVIRIKLAPKEEPAPPPPTPRSNKGAMALAAVVVAVLFGWFGIGSLKSDPPPPPVVAAKAIDAAPMPTPVEPEPPQQPDAPPSAVSEVVPDVPQSALNTIRGTVRVAVRVDIDKQGKVVAATAADRGPSRYFERLSIEAAKKWTFTPATMEDSRVMLVQFNFTRDGATAHWNPAA